MRALKRVAHRDWERLRELWLGHLPSIDFSKEFPRPTVEELPPINYPAFNASGLSECLYPAGLREAVFREALTLVRKFIYCSTSIRTLCHGGRNTWTAIGAYEAAFYGAKAFCLLLGISPAGRNSKSFYDIFFATERKVKGRKETYYDTLRVHQFGDRLTHEVLWGLTERLIETTDFPQSFSGVRADMRMIDWDTFSHFRNRVLYDCAFWPFSDDASACDLIVGRYNREITEAAHIDGSGSTAPFAREYFMAATSIRTMLHGMLADMASLATALQSEVDAFNALNRPPMSEMQLREFVLL